jgi:hypothetical protein
VRLVVSGLELPAALAAAGPRDVEPVLTSRLVRGGSEESAFYAMALREAAPRLIASGLLTADDLAEPLALVDDPASPACQGELSPVVHSKSA